MNAKKLMFSLLVACCTLTSCDLEKKTTTKTATITDKQNVSLAISGMTCEIGCAKTIESKLSKKEGVLAAKVIFSDSIANIEFDASKTSKKDLIAFVDGIAGGDLYKASETSKKAHTCSDACQQKCEMNKEKKECKKECKMECCKDKKA